MGDAVMVNRREFMIDATRISAAAALGTAGARRVVAEERKPLPRDGVAVAIPMPLQVVIDDVGWWSGEDGSARQEPYRTGIHRHHVPADYRAIVALGRALDIRPQAALILCEWDKANILRKIPESTWMGERWDNSRWVGPWQEEAADAIRSNPTHFECTIHGVGHEHWSGERFTRAEWADPDGRMRPPELVERLLDAFAAIMDQHRLGDFPRSFVPTAFRHTFGPSEGREVSVAELLRRRGVTYINTPFRSMANAGAVSHGVFGFDAGVMTVERGEDLLNWDVIGQTPIGRLSGPTCGLHWPNLLHPDPERNMEIVAAWVALLTPYNDRADMLLSPNSVSFQHQLAHHVCTTATLLRDSIELDFSETDALPGSVGDGALILKVRSASALEFTSDTVRITSQSPRRSEDDLLYTLQLERQPNRANAQVSFAPVA